MLSIASVLEDFEELCAVLELLEPDRLFRSIPSLSLVLARRPLRLRLRGGFRVEKMAASPERLETIGANFSTL
jgi:hypothetical protein